MSKTEVLTQIPNSVYHSGEQYKDYISSTSLKYYREGGLAAKTAFDTPRVDKVHFDNGSLVHDMIAARHPEGLPWETEYAEWAEAPRNKATGEYLGTATKGYVEAYQLAKGQSAGKTPVTPEQLAGAKTIVTNLFEGTEFHPSREIFLKLFQNGIPEVSYFTTNYIDGVNIKTRKDLDGERFFVDYKTIDGDLSTFIQNIGKLGYDISAGMYYANKEASFVNNGEPIPTIKAYWVVIQICPPYDWIIVSMDNYFESGKEKFLYLLQRHQRAKQTGKYGSLAEYAVTEHNKYGIFVPTPSSWQTKINNLI